jgi:hypothetical protein
MTTEDVNGTTFTFAKKIPHYGLMFLRKNALKIKTIK